LWFELGWDTVTDSYKLTTKTATGTYTDSSTTALGSHVFQPYLQIGSRPLLTTGVSPADCDIVDFIFNTSEKVDYTSHHTADIPYGDATAIANANSSVIISPYGIQLNKAEISMYDKKGRFIDVGSQGLLARDASGNVIHDIVPDNLNSYFSYAGHFFGFDGLAYTTTIASYNVSSGDGIKNKDLSTLSLNSDIDFLNYKSIYVGIYLKSENDISVYDLPVYNSSARRKIVAFNGSSSNYIGQQTNALLKIHNVSGSPYMSIYIDFAGTAGNHYVNIYLLGVTL
jgi:hypothetical protein